MAKVIRITSVRRSTSGRLHSCKNAHGVKVKRCCASCQHKCIETDGTRVCAQMMIKVEQRFKCKQWLMSDGLKNAGKGGGVVRLKAAIEREQCQACLSIAEREQARCGNIKGTTEIIIQ